jgi:1-deoxyxylulose-5-phosphate synthase
MTFGSHTDEVMARRIVDLCFERGINFIDTANVYNLGRSEAIIGNLLKGRRSHAVLATKVGLKMGDDPRESGLSAASIMKSIDESLRRLQCDYVDIYYLHQPDYSVPIEETLDALQALVRTGKIRYFGISNYAAWQLCEVLWTCNKSGYSSPAISQPLYNLLARGIEDEYIPMSKRFGRAVAVYNPLARGLLAGATDRSAFLANCPTDDFQRCIDRYQHPAFLDAVDELRRISATANRSLIDVALNWLLHHTSADCVILGAWNSDQFEQNLDVICHGALTNETVKACDNVWHKLRGTVPRYSR